MEESPSEELPCESGNPPPPLVAPEPLPTGVEGASPASPPRSTSPHSGVEEEEEIRITRKEGLMFAAAFIICFPAAVDNTALVFYPCFVASWVLLLIICITHSGNARPRTILGGLMTGTFLFVGIVHYLQVDRMDLLREELNKDLSGGDSYPLVIPETMASYPPTQGTEASNIHFVILDEGKLPLSGITVKIMNDDDPDSFIRAAIPAIASKNDVEIEGQLKLPFGGKGSSRFSENAFSLTVIMEAANGQYRENLYIKRDSNPAFPSFKYELYKTGYLANFPNVPLQIPIVRQVEWSDDIINQENKRFPIPH
jgi:hypothetical protein